MVEPFKTTTMRYQVEAFGVVQNSGITTLKFARRIKSRFVKAGANDAQIARYDISEASDYYEVVE